MYIIDALKKLDPENDSHWNKDGAPNMAAVEALVGDRNISREQVTEAAPLLSRTNSEFPLSDEEKAKEKEEAEAKEKEEAELKAKEEAAEKVKEEAEHDHDEECESSESKIKELGETVAELMAKKVEIEKEIKEKNKQRDSLINKRPQAHVNENQKSIMNHIQKQNARIQEKYKNFGKDSIKSQLDKSMEHKRGRNSRPSFNGKTEG